jgi:hypothetical protein
MDETRPPDETRDAARHLGPGRRPPDPVPDLPPNEQPDVRLDVRPGLPPIRQGRPVLELRLGDVVRLRKAHPCGGTEWLVDRLGADIGLRCLGCSRHVLIERRSLEGRIVAFASRGDEALSQAVRPHARDEVPRLARGSGGDEAVG